MPVFVLIVFLAAGLLWLLLSFAFIPFGRFVSKLWRDAKDAMDKEDPDENDETKE
ncbi:hypothetical protein [Intestinimonas butyriciproducens]|uniref:hypothetical protein n=1 Tax=Intestinimonas butyriciproducens TaxID=1297617 RepID=UPI00189C2769|nr:hypothetical protein [Intestinimonas butyriciproducens]MDB7829162.1 hypothetical protein [Intestinimonas butyriciproducens]